MSCTWDEYVVVPHVAGPAPAAEVPPVLDPASEALAHHVTLVHVVRAVAHSDFLPQALRLTLASPEHLHDPELLYRTRGVRGKYGRTLLMRAVVRLDVARAAEILGACPTPATRAELLALVDDEGWAALHLACSDKRLDEEAALRVVELLLANGADPLALQRDPEDDDDVAWHAIHHAAQWSARLVQRLLQAGASIDGDVEATSTLIAAAAAGTAQGVRMIPQLVALGARETLGIRAMMAFARHPAVGVQPSDGEVVAALNALVSVGCSLTQPDGDGFTPLENAAYFGNPPVVCALLSLGEPAASSSMFHGAKHPPVIRVLLAAGAPADALVDLDGGLTRSPLMQAARASALESVEVLLAAGASVGLRNKNGRTALTFSVAGSTFDLRVVEALLAAGVGVNARDKGGATALHFLAAHRAQQPWAAGAARLLLARSADACAVDNAGRTPAQRVSNEQRGGELHRLLLEAELGGSREAVRELRSALQDADNERAALAGDVAAAAERAGALARALHKERTRALDAAADAQHARAQLGEMQAAAAAEQVAASNRFAALARRALDDERAARARVVALEAQLAASQAHAGALSAQRDELAARLDAAGERLRAGDAALRTG